MPYHNPGPATQPAEAIESPASEIPDHDERAESTELSATGYTVTLTAQADGRFRVSGPTALPGPGPTTPGAPGPELGELSSEAGAPGTEEAHDLDSMGDAFRAVLDILKAHPIQATEQASFEAGYGREDGARELDAPEPGPGGAL